MRDYRIVETRERIIADNDAAAAAVRNELRAQGTFFINLMGSPGAGKTTTLLRTIEALRGRFRIGVMEADADGDVDAARIAAAGIPVIQLHTGGLCHMDADMTRRGLAAFGVLDEDESGPESAAPGNAPAPDLPGRGLDVVFLENVGNLVCPAEFDVGADLSAMILSVPEGDDKPLKYPLMFTVSDCMLVNKIDAAPVFDFDLAAAAERAERLHPGIAVFPVSAATGEGFGAWTEWLAEQIGRGRTAAAEGGDAGESH